jgi:CBS-domain-containing membrane protein
VDQCERLMQEHQVRRIPVVDADCVIGIVAQAELVLKDRCERVHRNGGGNLTNSAVFPFRMDQR